jgi:RNA recognition motif-containing protein
MTNVFVGNLDITVTEQQLRELFAAHGAVETITIVTDRDTGEPRGIAFVLCRRRFNPIRHAIPVAEIIGDTGRDLRTRQLSLDSFFSTQ